jgi:DNA-directed RNA polymerase subunit L/DNA-directed RNA polymerase alpha subunit
MSRFIEYTEPANAPVLLGTNGPRSSKIAASFRLKDTNITMANTIRRSILVHTASVGFRTEPYEKSDVEIQVNTTPLVNEMIAHRIGMIPIKASPETFDPAAYEFHIDVENGTKEIMDVRTSDIRVYMRSENPLTPPVEVKSSDFFPPDPITGDTILITRLRPQWNPTALNERLKLKAKATISTGKENIRWCPATQVSYAYTPNPDPDHINEVFVNWLQANKKIADPASLTEEKVAELKREFDTMEIQRCYLRNEKNEPNDFTFSIESVGIQTVPEIVKNGLRACEALVQKYADCDQVVPENLVFQAGDSRFASIDAIFQNEDHTLGNLLETYVVENHIDGDQVPKINYVGYKVPHPLRHEMFVRMDVRTTEEVESNTPVSQEVMIHRAKQVIAQSCKKLAEEFHSLQSEWDART